MEAFGWVLGMAILAIVLGPFAVTLVRRLRHQHRRRLVDSPRKISIVGSELRFCADDRHARDRARVRHDGGGGYRSVCTQCGAPLGRTRHGTWRALEE
jgi:hypothetical protein